MERIVIFGNSGSGKSSLARTLSERGGLAHLDLDRIAWEPHKYESREAQDSNLRMLIEWVREYETRGDEFSLREHRRLFDEHAGPEVAYGPNAEAARRAGR